MKVINSKYEGIHIPVTSCVSRYDMVYRGRIIKDVPCYVKDRDTIYPHNSGAILTILEWCRENKDLSTTLLERMELTLPAELPTSGEELNRMCESKYLDLTYLILVNSKLRTGS